jgi:hypothetical protein
MHPPARLSLCLGLLVQVLSAQTFIVHPTPGAGDFVDLQSAVDAARDGATIRITAGTYPTAVVTITAKALTIVGDPGLLLQGGLILQATSWTQPVALVGLHYDFVPHVPGATRTYAFSVIGCNGPVLMDDCEFIQWNAGSTSLPGGLFAQSSSQVMARNCRWLPCEIRQSTVVFERPLIIGLNGALCCPLTFPTPGLTVYSGSDVTVVGGTILGGHGMFWLTQLTHEPGIRSLSASLRLLDGLTLGTNLCPTCPPAPDGPSIILNLGQLSIDPSVTMQTTVVPPIHGGSVQTVAMPSVTSTDAGLGGTLSATAAGPAGEAVVLLFGFPGLPLSIPGILHSIWLDPLLHNEVVALGLPPLSAAFTVPVDPFFQGVRVGWQSIAFPTSGAEASNPSWALVR